MVALGAWVPAAQMIAWRLAQGQVMLNATKRQKPASTKVCATRVVKRISPYGFCIQDELLHGLGLHLLHTLCCAIWTSLALHVVSGLLPEPAMRLTDYLDRCMRPFVDCKLIAVLALVKLCCSANKRLQIIICPALVSGVDVLTHCRQASTLHALADGCKPGKVVPMAAQFSRVVVFGAESNGL